MCEKHKDCQIIRKQDDGESTNEKWKVLKSKNIGRSQGEDP